MRDLTREVLNLPRSVRGAAFVYTYAGRMPEYIDS